MVCAYRFFHEWINFWLKNRKQIEFFVCQITRYSVFYTHPVISALTAPAPASATGGIIHDIAFAEQID
jgi:hypothetical protein